MTHVTYKVHFHLCLGLDHFFVILSLCFQLSGVTHFVIYYLGLLFIILNKLDIP